MPFDKLFLMFVRKGPDYYILWVFPNSPPVFHWRYWNFEANYIFNRGFVYHS